MVRIKVKINQIHFAYIDSELMKEFNRYSKVINMTSFVKESFYNQFNYLITSKDNFKIVDQIVKDNFYQDKSEWLREIMRNKIRKEKEGL